MSRQFGEAMGRAASKTAAAIAVEEGKAARASAMRVLGLSYLA